MYGGASKLGGAGRGSGRGGPGIRLSSTYPPPHRLSNSSSSRLSLGGSSSNPRNRSGPPSNAVEETFSLVPGNDPPAFAMIIKLTPDLVDEIKKAEAQGRSARIKFDPIATNADGNLIDVGDKEFKFTWSREFGDLCDIYEERRNGEDGNGLLVETGSAWRKVNVQRILDESTKQQVKMRSEEADRKHKSRKAIVLEHGNPSMKSQLKQLQAAESNPWRQFKNKKEPPFKKRKFEPPQAGGSNKSSAKSVIASSANVKTRHSSSPVPSPSEQIGAPTSPLRGGTIVKPSHLKSQENACESGKNITPKPSSAVAETSGRKGDFRAETMDLQNKLISLLTEKPGMSLKALEKAIGDTTPNAAKKIEPILRKIANLQPPGKYFLKTGPGTDSSKKVSLDSRSSPEDNRMQKLAPPEDHVQRPASEPRFSDNSPVIGRRKEEQSKSKVGESFDTTEKIDIEQHSPDHFGEKKVSDNSEGKAGSSSDSGTDSDSESVSSGSDTDSGSHSRSRSRSPVGTGSSSSSDSDSDASSNSKQGSDEDVDIMTSDDEKEPQHAVQASEPNFKGSPDPWNAVQNGTDEKHDGDGSDAVDIEGLGSDAVDIEDHRSDAVDIETHESDAAGMETHESDAVDVEKPLVDSEQGINVTANDSLGFGRKDAIDFSEPFHPDHDVIQDRQAFIGNLFEDNDNDNLRHDQSDTSERISQGKPKKHSKKNSDQKPNRHKRAKPENYAKVPVSGGKDAQLAESPNDRQSEDIDKGTKFHKTDEEENADYGSQKGYGQSFSARPNLDNHHPGQKLTDQSARGHDISGRFKHLEPLGHGDNKFLEKDSLGKGGFPVQREKGFREPQDEDAFAKEKRMPQNPKEGSAGRRHSAPFASQYSKHGEVVGKVNDVVQVSKSGMVSPPKDRSRVESITNSVVNEKNLQRELSDLELGELREPLTEDAPMKRQIERKGSFKLSESRTSISDNNSNVDFRKRKSAVKTTDMQKPSPTVSDGGKRMSEHHVDDSTWSQKAGHSQSRQMSKTDNAELEPQFSKLPDAENRLRLEEAGPNVGNNLEGYGESHKKVPTSSQGQDAKRGPSSQLARERKTKSSSTKADMIDGQKDKTLKESSKKARRRREVSTEEEDMSYYKYEKDEPDLKGPIKDFSQYKEYVLEYREKYDRYCSLNKILEKYRDEFQKYAKDLDSAKGRDADKYNKIVRKLKESYRQCGGRHKRLKKIFIILHEELKTIKQRIKDYANSTRD